MRFFLPKPLRGWRQFVGEVGIIVIGVLIALGAEQVVQDLNVRADERAFRATVDHEIGLNLFAYNVRARQFACDKARDADLKKWLDRARSGENVPALWPAGPVILSPYRSAWDNRDAEVFRRLPLQVRQKYAEFYDELESNWSTMQGEHASWNQLVPYVEAGPITLEDRRRIRPILTQLQNAHANLETNIPLSQKIAEVLKVREVAPDNMSPELFNGLAQCHSSVASPAETSSFNPRE
jgi:hypothetical protein